MAGTQKLSNDDVREIRAMREEHARLMERANELTYKKIAERFGVSKRTVEHIARYEQRLEVE